MAEYEENKSKALRQKAISLLYLLFIAMVFIYVPSDFLDSLNQTKNSFEKTAKELSDLKKSKFDLFENNNSNLELNKLVDSVKYKNISALTDSTVNYIESVKSFLLDNTGGTNQYGYPIKSKEFDVTDHLMLNTDKADELLIKLNQFKTKISTHATTDQLTVIDSILVIPNSFINFQGKQISWKEFYFKKAPLSATLMTLSKFQTEIRLIEYLILDKYERDFLEDVLSKNGMIEITSEFDQSSQNKKIVSAKKTYRIGEELVFFSKGLATKSQIEEQNLDAENDAENDYEVYIENSSGQKEEIKVDEDGVLRYTPQQPGQYQLVYKDKGEQKKLSVKVVHADPNVAKQNLEVLYTGIKNPLKVKYLEGDESPLAVQVSNGTIRQLDSTYYYESNKVGPMKLTVSSNLNGKQVTVAQKEFFVKELPLPYATINNERGGSIGTRLIKNQTKLEIKSDIIESISFFYVKEFELIRISSSGVVVNKTINQGANFNSTTKKIINEAQEGDTYLFKDITVIGNDGNLRQIQSIVFTTS